MLTAVHTTTITVSGYAPMVALQSLVNGRAIVTSTTSVALDTWRPLYARCAKCRVWSPPQRLDDDRLGWSGWCPACLAHGLARCRRRHGRLPDAHEFWCPACGGLYGAALQCPREADGRRRLRCRPCRQWQWLARDARRAGRPVPPKVRQ